MANFVGQAAQHVIKRFAMDGQLSAHLDRPAFMPAWKKLGSAKCDI
jgi:hypothetical protein